MKVHICALSNEVLKNCCCGSGCGHGHGNGNGNNGNHNGWNNPHNPHYGGAKAIDSDFEDVNFDE